jgi:DNA-binding transcriptional MerR regulator
MKKYKISEVAKVLGVSSETIRYYESLGIRKSARLVNNYRMYDDLDVQILSDYIIYKDFSFTLKETRNATTSDSADCFFNTFDEKIDQLERKIDEEQRLLEWMRFRKQDLMHSLLNLNTVFIQRLPAMYTTKLIQNAGNDLHNMKTTVSNYQRFMVFGCYIMPISPSG